MNTLCSIQAEAEDNACLQEAIAEAFSEIKRIECLCSRYLDDSQITRINRQAGKSEVRTDPETFTLIDRCIGFSRLTDGAFDITVAQAKELWRICRQTGRLPAEKQLKDLCKKIGYQHIALNYRTQSIYFNHPGLEIDLGAIAKGYAIDRAVFLLKKRSISCAQIDFGGHIYILNKEPQRIGIRNPVFPDETVTTVELSRGSISTSANYEREFKIAGKNFGHLLNPLTCSPCETDILSASVICPDAAQSDALSTAVFVSGFQKSRELFKRINNVEAIIVCKALFNRKRLHYLKGGTG